MGSWKGTQGKKEYEEKRRRTRRRKEKEKEEEEEKEEEKSVRAKPPSCFLPGKARDLAFPDQHPLTDHLLSLLLIAHFCLNPLDANSPLWPTIRRHLYSPRCLAASRQPESNISLTFGSPQLPGPTFFSLLLCYFSGRPWLSFRPCHQGFLPTFTLLSMYKLQQPCFLTLRALLP